MQNAWEKLKRENDQVSTWNFQLKAELENHRKLTLKNLFPVSKQLQAFFPIFVVRNLGLSVWKWVVSVLDWGRQNLLLEQVQLYTWMQWPDSGFDVPLTHCRIRNLLRIHWFKAMIYYLSQFCRFVALIWVSCGFSQIMVEIQFNLNLLLIGLLILSNIESNILLLAFYLSQLLFPPSLFLCNLLLCFFK